jgi:1-acyl-sn-glycerol-3-phosphate acyltransferase
MMHDEQKFGHLTELQYTDGSYRTEERRISLLSRVLPTLAFYRRIFPIILRASSKAKRAKYNNKEWCMSSYAVLTALEEIGIKLEITGADNFRKIQGPCVFLANHMSTLETFVLPIVIAPYKPVTFVVKKSLVDYPVFGHVMRSRDPVTVGRTNPREDLRAVIEGGIDRLTSGTSIIIFPQTTRYLDFDPRTFNSIGIKLAKKADVPVVPLALKTDAWGNGRVLRDFGKMEPSKPVFLAFGKPLSIKDSGSEEHKKVIDFIRGKLKEWES